MDAMYKQLLTFLLVFGTGVGAQFTLEPQKVSVLQGSNVSFIATVPADWNIITWEVDNLLVLTIYSMNGPISDNATVYKARNLTTNSAASAWEFIIVGVQRRMQGNVVCTVQGQTGSKTANLEVQVQGTVDIQSGNKTVNEDEEVEFRAEMYDWNPVPEVSWLVDGNPVSQSLYNTSFQSQALLTNGTSVLRMRAVRNAEVQCRVSLSRATETVKTVFLTVVPKPTDWTILIAVVVSFSSFALLVLLIILIVFCCRRKKEKENQLRQGRMQAGAVAAQPRRGTINVGFAMDERAGVTPSADGGLSQTNSSPIYQIPHVENQNRTGVNDYPAENGLDHRHRHRHLTIV